MGDPAEQKKKEAEEGTRRRRRRGRREKMDVIKGLIGGGVKNVKTIVRFILRKPKLTNLDISDTFDCTVEEAWAVISDFSWRAWLKPGPPPEGNSPAAIKDV